jgi:hypothetical protein
MATDKQRLESVTRLDYKPVSWVNCRIEFGVTRLWTVMLQRKR